jgi:cytochrome c oxidase subunit II
MNRSTRLRRVGRLALGVGLVLLLASCASDAPQDALDPAGPAARQIDDLFRPVFWVAVAVFVIVEALIVLAVIRFRRRGDDDDAEFPEQIHGNTRLEVGWTILPALVLGVVAVFTVPVIFDQNEKPNDALEVTVYGQKYWWGYTYGAQDQFGIDAEFTTANELHIPAGVPVFLELRSLDVIHSFWAPRLNGKRDVTPGRIHTWTIEADEPGVFSGQCAEFCGTSHPNMRLKVVAHDQAGWDDWVGQMQAPVEQPTSGMEAEGFELFQQRGCAGCHNVDGQYEEVSADSVPAPDLTKLFTRDCFAGCIYDLNDRNELEAWLRDPQRKAGSLMVIGQLTEDEIDRLYAYLRTLE